MSCFTCSVQSGSCVDLTSDHCLDGNFIQNSGAEISCTLKSCWIPRSRTEYHVVHMNEYVCLHTRTTCHVNINEYACLHYTNHPTHKPTKQNEEPNHITSSTHVGSIPSNTNCNYSRHCESCFADPGDTQCIFNVVVGWSCTGSNELLLKSPDPLLQHFV